MTHPTATRPGLWMLALVLLAFTNRSNAAGSCIILQYHQVSTETPRSTSVTPPEFEAHLRYLDENAFQVWPLARVVEHLQTEGGLPEHCVAITFDDAYQSVYQEAFPRLRARGWPFTVFVSTQAVDRGLRSYMSWDQMHEMAGAGVSFGNHGHSHAHLVRRLQDETDADWEARVARDILTAQTRVRAELGQDPRLFAYPYGEYDNPLKAVVSDLGLVGFGQQSGPAWSGSDRLALPRFPIAAGYAALDDFSLKVNTLPLPVLRAEPGDPLLPVEEWRPRLTLRLAPGDYRRGALRCYVSGQGLAEVSWLNNEDTAVEIRARAPLAVGRDRYNCTAPSTRGGRYYWYSHLWIR
jgi:biofilm PGA synthesis lipoprotein PgaB